MVSVRFFAIVIAVAAEFAVGENATCRDATNDTDPDCYTNTLWAMKTGIYTHPDWYTSYPVLSEAPINFKSFQYVLAQKMDGTKDDTAQEKSANGWQCPYPCNFSPPQCMDVTASSPGMCYNNTVWAMQTGINVDPSYYIDYQLTVNSSFQDFQYALHDKIGLGGGEGWQCPSPCTSTFSSTTTVAVTATTIASTPETTATATATTTTTTAGSGPAIPWWAWLILAISCSLFGGVGAWYVLRSKKTAAAPQKKKRATRAPLISPPTAPLTATAMEPASTACGPPVYAKGWEPWARGNVQYAYIPVPTVEPAVEIQAPVVVTQQPTTSYQLPVAQQSVAPVVTIAPPVYATQEPASASGFIRMDPVSATAV